MSKVSCLWHPNHEIIYHHKLRKIQEKQALKIILRDTYSGQHLIYKPDNFFLVNFNLSYSLKYISIYRMAIWNNMGYLQMSFYNNFKIVLGHSCQIIYYSVSCT